MVREQGLVHCMSQEPVSCCKAAQVLCWQRAGRWQVGAYGECPVSEAGFFFFNLWKLLRCLKIR